MVKISEEYLHPTGELTPGKDYDPTVFPLGLRRDYGANPNATDPALAGGSPDTSTVHWTTGGDPIGPHIPDVRSGTEKQSLPPSPELNEEKLIAPHKPSLATSRKPSDTSVQIVKANMFPPVLVKGRSGASKV